MVSRPKNLPRQHLGNSLQQAEEEEEDIWYNKDKLCREHVQEVLTKWKQIDDEIWAKIIVFERNRRVAKAYARAPVLTVNGSDEEFDGFRIGLNGFDSPMKDRKTEEYKRHIGHGIKIKMDDAGNVLIKRVSKCNAFVKCTNLENENAIGNEILKLPNCSLQMEKAFKLFDMKKFQGNLKRELRRAYPDRKRLENQCLSAVAFVRNEEELLDCPIWILIINVVAIEMLKAKLPPIEKTVDMRDRPRIPVPHEDPYSLPANNHLVGRSMNMSHEREALLQNQQTLYRTERPPRLPPRENFHQHGPPKPNNDERAVNGTKAKNSSNAKEMSKDKKQYEDPYYHGLRARVSSFVSKTKSKLKKPIPAASYPVPPPQHEAPSPFVEHKPSTPSFNIHQHPMWYTRSIESGLDSDFSESPYTKIYGRIPVPRGYVPQQRIMHIGEWD